MHGKKKLIHKTGESQLFKGLDETFPAARYHSLAALEDTLPGELRVTARSDDGSNAIGSFYHFIEDPEVQLIGCEAAGRGVNTAETASTIATGRLGIFHGMKSYFCQDEYGQIAPVYSISAGLDYPGVDLIELGIPFSDPTAEGPVIQAANMRALAGGVTTDKIFAMVERIRQKTDIPMVFMTYANVVFSYGKGTEDFIRRAAEIGMNGLILPDVPFEEKEEFDSACRQYGLDLISLIAPTSHERIKMIAKEANGFVYCVSSLGVTGTRTEITTDIGAMVRLVKEAKDVPCAVGFGISTPEQAKNMASQSDGAIVGSAIVKLCAAYGTECVPKVKEYVKAMKDAVREA